MGLFIGHAGGQVGHEDRLAVVVRYITALVEINQLLESRVEICSFMFTVSSIIISNPPAHETLQSRSDRQRGWASTRLRTG